MNEFTKKLEDSVNSSNSSAIESSVIVDNEMLKKLEDAGVALGKPVTMTQFDDIVEFTQKQNNFYMYFLALNDDDPKLDINFMINIYHNIKANKRFRTLHPMLYKEVYESVDKRDGVWMKEQELDINKKLFVAYELMSKLVDEEDEGIVVKDGFLDKNFLLR